MFDVSSKTKVFTQIVIIHNEIRLYELMNVTGLIFNLSEKEVVKKDGKPFRFKKALMKDNTDTILISLLMKSIINCAVQ